MDSDEFGDPKFDTTPCNAIGCSMMQKPTLQPPLSAWKMVPSEINHGTKVPSDGGIPQKIAQEIMFTGKMMRKHKFWGVPSGYGWHSHGKSQFLISKPSISMGHLYHGYVK